MTWDSWACNLPSKTSSYWHGQPKMAKLQPIFCFLPTWDLWFVFFPGLATTGIQPELQGWHKKIKRGADLLKVGWCWPQSGWRRRWLCPHQRTHRSPEATWRSVLRRGLKVGDKSRHLCQVFATTSPQVLEGLLGKVSPQIRGWSLNGFTSILRHTSTLRPAIDIAIANLVAQGALSRRFCAFDRDPGDPRKTLRQLGKEGKLRSSWSTVMKGRPVEKAWIYEIATWIHLANLALLGIAWHWWIRDGFGIENSFRQGSRVATVAARSAIGEQESTWTSSITSAATPNTWESRDSGITWDTSSILAQLKDLKGFQ